jgi:hypothetical protein
LNSLRLVEAAGIIEASATAGCTSNTFHSGQERDISMTLAEYSFGIGDRFGQEGCAQLRALQLAEEKAASLRQFGTNHIANIQS